MSEGGINSEKSETVKKRFQLKLGPGLTIHFRATGSHVDPPGEVQVAS